MDNQLQGPDGGNLESGTGAIDANQAGSLFASLLSAEPKAPVAQEPPKKENAQAEGDNAQPPATEQEALERAAAEEAAGKAEAKTDDDPDAEKIFTVKIDGKDVRLTADELINGYKAQKVSTQKFEQAAELRKQAEAERAQANAEADAARRDRQTYAQSLQVLGQQLQGVLANQSQVDMDRLSVENPAEYVKQLHLQNQRQAALQRVQFEQHRVAQQTQAEQQARAKQWQGQQVKAMAEHFTQQQEALLAKLPDWKDPTKASAAQAELSSYLEKEGFNTQEIQGVNDHRAVLLAHKAMQYDKLMAKARSATAKVATLPAKVERPGTNQAAPTDGRTAAMQRLDKSGRVEDAAAIFSQMFSS